MPYTLKYRHGSFPREMTYLTLDEAIEAGLERTRIVGISALLIESGGVAIIGDAELRLAAESRADGEIR